MERKRLTAIKSKIKPIIKGKFISPGGFNPSFIITPQGRKISRVRLLGTVVNKFSDKEKKFSSITIDDASATIRVRAFNSRILDEIEKGDIVDVIGKIKCYQKEIYIIPEVVRKVDIYHELLRDLEIKNEEKKWEEKRNIILQYQKQVMDIEELKALAKDFSVSPEEVESILQSNEKEDEDEEKNKILDLIEKCDKGDGCDYSELVEKSGLDEELLDSIINKLLVDGLCFEPRPGKIKKL